MNRIIVTISFVIATTLSLVCCTNNNASNINESANSRDYHSPPISNPQPLPQTKQNNIKVITCEPDYQTINYCSDEFVAKINKESKLPANFAHDKRLLTTKIKMNNSIDGVYEYYFIIIDLKKFIAIPVEQILTNFVNSNLEYIPNIAPSVSFSANSKKICFTGSLIGYRDVYHNVDNACYELDPSSKYLIPSNAPFTELDIKKLIDQKEKNDFNELKKPLKSSDSYISLQDIITCTESNNDDKCKNITLLSTIEDLPSNLKEEFKTVQDIDTIYRLTNIDTIEVYLLARTSTDVEQYTIATYKNHLIDKLLVGEIGLPETQEKRFFISNDHEQIIISEGGENKEYTINSSGEIRLDE